MKICFWVSHISTVGGVQRVTALIANELVKSHQVFIVSNDKTDTIKQNIYHVSDNVEIIEQPAYLDVFGSLPKINKFIKRINKKTGLLNKEAMFRLADKVYFPVKGRKKVADFFNKYNFDVIIGVQGYNSLALAMIADLLNAKTVGWQHNSFNAYFRNKDQYYWNQDILFKHYLNKLDEYIVLNENDKKLIDRSFHINSKFIYNPKSFVSLEKSDSSCKCFLAAGRFCKAKGFDILVDAMAQFTKEVKDWKLFLVGDGEDKKQIENMIVEKNLTEYIEMPGYCKDIKSYFLKSSVLLLPSRWEGMPMIVLEALEMGCSVISFNIDAITPLITDGQEGLVVAKQEGASGFAQAMLRLSTDEKMRRMLSEKAIEKSSEFSIELIVPQWISIICGGEK